MPELRQKSELKRSVSKTRKEFIRVILDQENELDRLLIELQSKIDVLVKRKTENDKITDKDPVLLGLTPLWKEFFDAYQNLLIEKNGKVAGVIAEAEKEALHKRFSKVQEITETQLLTAVVSFDKLTEGFARRYARNMLLRVFPLGKRIRVGQKIVSLRGQSLNVARSIVEVGIREGKSAKDIANDLEMYVRPLPRGFSVSPFQFIRDFLGRHRVIKIERGEVPRGSLSFNAFTIARTEINYTYRDALVQLHKNKPWVEGYRWNLSLSHPKKDICDLWAEGSPYDDDELPTGHPNCLCYLTIEFKDENKLLS